MEQTLLSWRTPSFAQAGAPILPEFGIHDPIAWFGTSDDLGESIRDHLFPEGRSRLAPRYISLLQEVMCASGGLDVMSACGLVCRTACLDVLHTVAACNP